MKPKPCPFCGGEAHTYLNAPSSDQQPWLHIVCLKCSGSAPTENDWNRRALTADVLTNALVRYGIIHESAIDDPQGYDGGQTKYAILKIIEEL